MEQMKHSTNISVTTYSALGDSLKHWCNKRFKSKDYKIEIVENRICVDSYRFCFRLKKDLDKFKRFWNNPMENFTYKVDVISTSPSSFYNSNHWDSYVKWCEKHIGQEGKYWRYRRTRSNRTHFYFRHHEHILLFQLTWNCLEFKND
jgi:hypothetical protein